MTFSILTPVTRKQLPTLFAHHHVTPIVCLAELQALVSTFPREICPFPLDLKQHHYHHHHHNKNSTNKTDHQQ